MDRDIHDIFDVILKIIIIVYGVEFLRYIGVEKKIKKILKTEFVTLNGEKLYLDFLCLLEDGTLCHIEFQFPKARPKDLDRFFNYNIVAEVKHGSLTETIVINFTSKKSDEKARKIGFSKSFHPKQVYLGDIDFEEYWRKINIKAESNLKLDSFEEITLMITSLVVECENKAKMLKKISKLLKNKELFDERRFEFIQAVIEIELNNLIPKKQRDEIIEGIDMSPQAEEIITQVIDEVHKKSVSEARLEGREEGIKEGKDEAKEEIAANLKDILDDEEISKRTGLSIERVKQL